MTNLNQDPQPSLTFGMVGFVIGAIALCLVLLQFFAGPFTPQQSVGEAIGEIAADISRSAWNKLRNGTPPTPEAAALDIDRIMIIGSVIAAVVAIVLGVFGVFRKEPKQHVKAAIACGSAAILFQFVATALMLILGVILLLGIMSNLGEILGSFGG